MREYPRLDFASNIATRIGVGYGRLLPYIATAKCLGVAKALADNGELL
jgi:hypothetical protein